MLTGRETLARFPISPFCLLLSTFGIERCTVFGLCVRNRENRRGADACDRRGRAFFESPRSVSAQSGPPPPRATAFSPLCWLCFCRFPHFLARHPYSPRPNSAAECPADASAWRIGCCYWNEYKRDLCVHDVIARVHEPAGGQNRTTARSQFFSRDNDENHGRKTFDRTRYATRADEIAHVEG